MSRMDISGGYSSGRESKGGVVARPSPGPRESLATPGETVTPPVSAEANLLGQLLTALGDTGQVAGQIDRTLERRKAIEARNANELKALDEGLASEHYNNLLPSEKDKINKGEVVVAEGSSIEDTMKARVAEQASGFSPAYQEQYRRLMTPKLIQAAYDKQADDAKLAGLNGIDNLQAKTATATSSVEVDEAVKAALSLNKQADVGLTDDQVYARVIMPAAEVAADTGDVEKLNHYMEVLGQRNPDDQVKLQSRLQNFYDQRFAELNRQAVVDAKMSVRQQITESIGTGSSSQVADKVIKLPDGSTYRVNVSDEVDYAWQQAFANIEKIDTPNGRAGHISMQAKLASDEGYIPPQWGVEIATGNVSTSTSSLSEGDETPITDRNVKSYALYKQLAREQPLLLKALLKDEKSYEVFALANDFQEMEAVGPDDKQALLAAYMGITRPGNITPLNPKYLGDAVVAKMSNPINLTEVAGVVGNRARALIKGGIAPERAMDLAVKDYKKTSINIDGYWSSAAGLPSAMVSDLPKVSRAISATYATESKAGEAENFVLRRGVADGFWVLYDKRTEVPVHGEIEQKIFSTKKLYGWWKSGLPSAVIPKASLTDEQIIDRARSRNMEGQPNSAHSGVRSSRPKGKLLGEE